ncbi:hypothetical protein KC909_06925, partial [Candidatus Dojkabacteria bacterium]|nr:hypothetical protein [Candidatus Dojkabacteria bacterium]
MKKNVTIYVSNMSEDIWEFIDSFNDFKMKSFEIQENARLADQHLHGVCDEKELVFISPYVLEQDFVEYIKSLYQFNSLNLFSPEKHTGEICTDLINDKKLFMQLKKILDEYSQVTLKSYSASQQFYLLKNRLIAEGYSVVTPESPTDEAAWTVNFFGSKSGIRQLAHMTSIEEPDFQVAEGLICMGIFEASRIAANKYLKKRGVVIKTNKGHSGSGVLIFREGDLPNEYHNCQQKLESILSKDNYWVQFPIVVEDLVNVNLKVGGGFPNTEYLIKGNGEIELLYYGGLIVTDQGVFKGMEIGDNVFNDRFLASIIDFGYFIGEKYSKFGYRGYYDVDMIASKNGNIYVSESNTRRTGSTHVYQSLSNLIGEDFVEDTYVISNNIHYRSDKAFVKFNEVTGRVQHLMFDKNSKEGVIFTSANILSQNAVGYIIVSPTKRRTVEI